MDRRNFLKATGGFAVATAAELLHVRAAAPETMSLRAARASLAANQQLTLDQKHLIIDAAINVMEQVYVHRAMKMAEFGIDVVPQLRALRARAKALNDLAFHREIRRIFVQLRDRHTHYKSGEPTQTYSLPFSTEYAFDEGRWGYFITAPSNSMLPVGSRIEAWNGGNPERIVEELAQNVGAGNYPSRLAMARRSLTKRLTSTFDPPVEDDVRLAIIDPAGAKREVPLEWHVEQVQRKLEIPAEHRFELGIDESHYLTAAHHHQGWVSSDTITARGKTFGLLTIHTFHAPDNFMEDVRERLKSLPQTGLVIDIRHNGGGTIQVGERLLQLFSKTKIEPHTFRCRASDTMALATGMNSGWHHTIVQGISFGSEFSADFRLTNWDQANAIGRVYPGPVVLLVSGITYSTADMFASGFQSHNIGKVIGVDENIGAGGANNLLSYADLLSQLPKSDPRFQPLPSGVDFGFAIRQAIRKGPNYNGMVLEDEGIRIDYRYKLTKRDVLPDTPNADLFEFACGLL